MLSKDLFGKLQVTPQPVGESVPVKMSRKPENPNQYKLFMRPQELMSSIRHSVDEDGNVSYETLVSQNRDNILRELWRQKDRELDNVSHTGLLNSIEQHGILRPITLEVYHNEPITMGEGHHRVAAALRVEKKTGREVYIPVVYDRDWNHTDEHPVETDEERAYRHQNFWKTY